MTGSRRSNSEGEKLDPRTLAAQALGREDESTGAVVPPIHFSTTFTRRDDYGPRDHVYIRPDSPNAEHAEDVLATLEDAVGAMSFGSGMAACTAAFHALESGDHVVCGKTVYHGVKAWLERFGPARGLTFTFVPNDDLTALKSAMQPGKTKLVWIETPANPLWTVTDIAAAAEIAHAAGAQLAVDSTCATPVLTKPLTLGADLVVHAATKYLGGHSDVLAGMVAAREDTPLWRRIREHRTFAGPVLGAMEAFLLTRGMRTLFVRVERQCQSAMKVAEFLAGHPKVDRVRYPGLPGDPGHAVASKQMLGGFGGMLSFQPAGDRDSAIRLVLACRVLKPATSLGGVESLIEHRKTSEGDIVTETPDNLIRISVGIEAVDDLIQDLDRALAAV
ncbi:aminotransferase class I/II-fold pyridoxal phosphate-dependent enzyme [Rhodospirillaceae bacterium KN72]|uniref:Aminotransferase class I/II-fold pyridoxal phosphate-dependent enzyme n=1 Tax=Pacificispira spongiicola TaxID=2729598 RepID=A0A7Y0E0N6_9PROT|nr:aminotransferase class I/II-fold pyridoxal phosphate-dependent enzyme [Pacificispira spongiicola]NMM44311.1 aminotransferase class I/II-fold pyridoxal phosphate-dependent enzyme [Pacificispira spongiicola]